MSDLLLKLGEHLAIGFGYVVALLGVARLVQQFVEPWLVPPNWRQWLGKLLRHRDITGPGGDARVTPPGDPPRTLGAVLLSSAGLFDRIFGSRHWTLRCALVSAAFTLTFSALSLWLVGALFSEGEMYLLIDAFFAQQNQWFLALSLLWSAFVDFISLWETRWVISQMRRDGNVTLASFYLFIDVLFSYAIFVLGAALLKTALDTYYVIPLTFKHGAVTVTSQVGASVTLDAHYGALNAIWLYLGHAIKLAVLSTLAVLDNFTGLYWTFSLFINGTSPYIIPASTFWATAHLFSVFVYAYIILWLMATRFMMLDRIVVPRLRYFWFGRVLWKGNLKPEEHAITIIVLNLGLYGGLLYFAAKLYSLV